MKNIEVINLVNSGVLNITAHDLTAEHSYKVVKFKKELHKAFDALQASEAEILKTVGIEDVNAFNTKLGELRKKPTKELAQMEETLKKQVDLSKELYNDEVTLDVKTMPYEEWKKLQDENHTEKTDLLVGYAEEVLEGVLWEAPLQ